jgi:putative transposase
MVDSNTNISLTRQCSLLMVGRTSIYYKPFISEATLELVRHIDELYTEDPTRGTRRMCAALQRQGIKIGRRKARSLMALLGIAAIYRKPNLSKAAPEHKVYPYLLRNVPITRVNQVWSTDITYIRLRHGFVYLCAVIDWYSRYVLSWRLSTTLDAAFCVEALQEALGRYGKPEVFNTDQGCQFTSEDFISVLEQNNITISMDGKGRALDNVFVERLWRTVKYEDIYLKDYGTVAECRAGLEAFFERYNNHREHQAIGYQYPSEIYFGKDILTKVAA